MDRAAETDSPLSLENIHLLHGGVVLGRNLRGTVDKGIQTGREADSFYGTANPGGSQNKVERDAKLSPLIQGVVAIFYRRVL